MKIDKNIIISKTIIFISSVILIFSFRRFLGTVNAIVAFAIAQAAIMLLKKDLTGNSLRNTIKFLAIYLYLGIFPFLASLNIYIGLIINFLAIFFIAYTLVYDLKSSIAFPFILGYVFLLTHSITLKELPLRIIGLSLGAFFIMFLQFLFNRNKCKKQVEESFNIIINETQKKIGKIISNKTFKDNESLINKNINIIINTIYGKRDNYFYLSGIDNININITLCLERLNYSLNNLNKHKKKLSEYEYFLKDLVNVLENIKKNFYNNEKLKEIDEKINYFIEIYEKAPNNYYIFYEFIQNIQMFQYYLDRKEILNKKDLKKINKDITIPKRFEIDNIFKFNFNRYSLKFTYAFRISLLISITYFFIQYFKIQYGNWIVYTLVALIQPYNEITRSKTKEEIKGTVLGIFLFTVFDLLVSNKDFKYIMLMIIYYLFIYFEDYKQKTMIKTILILGILSLETTHIEFAIVDRLIFMAIGAIIAFLGNKYIFKYCNKHSIKRFAKNDYNVSKDLLIEGSIALENKESLKRVNEILMSLKLIENKILLNNSDINNKLIQKFVLNEKSLNNNIYFLVYTLHKEGCTEEILKDLKIISKNLFMKKRCCILDERKLIRELKDNIRNKFNELSELKNKLIYINLYKILVKLEESDKLLLEIQYY
ncbi:FUSC family protein [Clostridium tarantellae]|uniref:Integral membrane bound transporter domain-containing protein n=1 Tax=Clostridium tarantellae TaxID=39493 RepID=A0A6I1MPG1_9CLOT|nr:FUSC family protein [Clostridium tarantellae]MPQ44122.1 hypothetical protein [Clostridium tarantellae]